MKPHLIIAAHPVLPLFRMAREWTGDAYDVTGFEAMGKALQREVSRWLKRHPGESFIVKDSEGRTLTYTARGIFSYGANRT